METDIHTYSKRKLDGHLTGELRKNDGSREFLKGEKETTLVYVKLILIKTENWSWAKGMDRFSLNRGNLKM